MTTITIPKELIKEEELVIIPRRKYEEFLRFQPLKKNKEFMITVFQKKRLEKARKNLAEGKYLTMHELKRKLGTKN